MRANHLSATELSAQAAVHSAHNYHPLPVVIATAEGAWVTDVDGRRYLDMLAAYSAIIRAPHSVHNCLTLLRKPAGGTITPASP